MTISRVSVLGTGVLGSQIAYQCAFTGVPVRAYAVDARSAAAARDRFAALADTYRRERVPGAGQGLAEQALQRLEVTSDLAAAVLDADLVIEAVPELLEVKREVYRKLSEVAPAAAIFATNSSTLLPSDLADATGRPDRFLALHFANRVWQANTAEVMGTEHTAPEVFAAVVAFAERIGMVPVPIHREKSGYVLNSLLVPWLRAALELAAGGYAEPADVDKVWRIATGAPLGPFQIYDVIGMGTPYNILAHGDRRARALAAWLKENYIDQGKLGLAAGEGFYRYRS